MTVSASTFNVDPPVCLQKESDDLILADFFGTEQIGKLDDFKNSLNQGGEPNKQNQSQSQSVVDTSEGSGPATETKSPLVSTPPIQTSTPNSASQSPRLMKAELDIKSIKSEPVSDVVSEMQQLRLRLQETARQEIAAINRQFSPKFSRPFPRGHGRQSSLDIGSLSRRSQLSGLEQSRHCRDGSLDLSFYSNQSQETKFENSASTSAVQLTEARLENSLSASGSGGHIRQYSLPSETNSFPNTGVVHLLKKSHSPSPLNAGLPYESLSLERTRSPSRSPTPPYQYYGHRKSSLGSSSGSGTVSPPPANLPSTVTTAYHSERSPQPLSPPLITSPKPFSTPPPTRITRAQHPQQAYNSSRHPNAMPTANKPPRPSSAYSRDPNPMNGAPPPPVQQQRITTSSQSTSRGSNRSQNVVHGSLDTKQASRQEIYAGTASVPRGHVSGGSTHYSTAVVRGKRNKSKKSSPEGGKMMPTHARSVDDTSSGGQYEHLMPRSGQSVSQQFVDALTTYDRLAPVGVVTSTADVDQPEQKSIPRNYRQQNQYVGGRNYPQMAPSPWLPVKGNGIPGESLQDRSAPVYPEEIQPYMTSEALKAQMKQFSYTPYSEQRDTHVESGSNNLHDMSEQTWC